MYMRKIAAAAAFACGTALALAPFASADTSSDWLSSLDGLLSGASPAATSMADFQVSFDGMDLFPTTDNLASATTVAGQFGLAIAYGNGANAVAEGGTGDYALASGTDALAKAGSTTEGATGFNYDTAEDIGNNTNGIGAPDGAYAGGGSLIGNTDAVGTASSHDSAYDIGNNGLSTDALNGGNSGSFAGDSGLIGDGNVAGSADTAYTAGNLNGFGDGSASVAGNNNFASSSGAETGTNEGSFAAFGNNNTAIADTSYTTSGDGVSATDGNGNYAYVYGPDNSTASAGGENVTTLASNSNIAYVSDPYGNVNAPDSAVAGASPTGPGGSDLAEVLYTHGAATATGTPNLYDIITPFGTSATPAAATAAADALPAAVPTEITTTVSSEITSANSTFSLEALLAGDSAAVIAPTAGQPFDTIPLADAPLNGTGTLDAELYGVNPVAAIPSSDPGAYDVFNGAEVRFDDAYNVALYALENQGALDPNVGDFFGSLPATFGTDTAAQAFESFYNAGIGDLSGFFGTDLSSLDISAATATSLFDLFDPSAAASMF
jgi:hypothetical protein